MSDYNKKFFIEFYKNSNNKLLLTKLNKFANLDISNFDKVLNNMKIKKEEIKELHKKLKKNNESSIINIKKESVKFYSAKCFDNLETEYKGSVSFVTDTFYNNDFPDSFSAMLNSNYFNCKLPNKYKRIIMMTNIFNMTILNFSTSNYSGRSLYRYLFTKIILGDDYEPELIIQNIGEYTGFFKDGTLGQEIIYYFIEIYCYDRYNFFYNMANDEYILKKNQLSEEKNTKIKELLENELWQEEYPNIDAVMYIDKSMDESKIVIGIETVVFINEVYLKKVKDIYINDGTDFKLDKTLVTNFTNPTINMNKLHCLLKEHNSQNQIMVGGGESYYNKYLKYKNKYLNLKNKLDKKNIF